MEEEGEPEPPAVVEEEATVISGSDFLKSK